MQKAVLRVTGPGKMDPNGRELSSSYLWRVAYCVVIDELRSRARRAESSLEAAGAVSLEPAPEPNPEERARGKQLGRVIASEILGLAPPRRVAVLLHPSGAFKPGDR